MRLFSLQCKYNSQKIVIKHFLALNKCKTTEESANYFKMYKKYET